MTFAVLIPALLVSGATLIQTSSSLSQISRESADAAIAHFAAKGLKPEQIAITVARLDRAVGHVEQGDFRGDQDMYPASVVKLFYLGYTAHLLESKKLKLTAELERGVHDMIVDSINDATALIVDTVTETTGGPELGPRELAAWMKKRQTVNGWYAGLGYPKLNACQKTWNEGPYGRERQGYGTNFELRNALSPNVCVRLMSEIALDKIVSPGQCEWMRKYLKRVIPADAPSSDEQATLFSGKVLPKGTLLWSKAGWTSTVRHDVAWVKFPNGHEYIWAIFTRDHSDEADLVPFVADDLIHRLGEK